MLGGTHLLFGFMVGTLLSLSNARIGSLSDGSETCVSGIVTCADSRGFILDDGTGKAFVRGAEAGTGDRVEATGTVALLDIPLILAPIVKKASITASPAVLVSLGALMPDFDTHLAGDLGELWGHRGVVHTPFSAVLLAISVLLIMSALGSAHGKKIAIYLFLGYLSHLLLDSITVFGIMVFFPFSASFYSISAPLTNIASALDPLSVVPGKIIAGSPFWNNFVGGLSTLGVISVWVYKRFF